MKKPFVLIAAIVAVLGLGTAVAVAKEKIKVETSVSLTASFHPIGPKPTSFQGEVKARKKGCEEGRTVAVSSGISAFQKVYTDKTNNRGRYKMFFRPPLVSLPFAKVRKMRITKDSGTTIVCKADKSEGLPFG